MSSVEEKLAQLNMTKAAFMKEYGVTDEKKLNMTINL